MISTKKGGRRKIIPYLILALLSMSFLVVPTVNQVGGNPGLIRVPLDYPSIQSAVDAAGPGDTILVANGIYQESVVIDKSLNLTGASNIGTIINATGSGNAAVTVVNAMDVSVQGFMIVDHDFFNDTVWVTESSRVTVSGNRMIASTYSNGMYVLNSSDVVVAGNTLTGNLYGIAVQGGFDNIIEGNNSTGNTAGVFVSASQANKVTDNVFRRNNFGARMLGSFGNILAKNTIANNSFAGIYLENSPGNLILENNVDFNAAVPTTYGIYVSSSTSNRLYYNNVRNNSIQLYAVTTPGDILQNYWNDSAPVIPKGNFWSDYKGTDSDGDGIGDTILPHPCPSGRQPCSYNGPPGVDYRPLMAPYVPPSMKVTASASPDVGLPPLQVDFTGFATGGVPPYSYAWELGDGTRASQQNVTNTYPNLGNFIVTLTVNDSLGAIQTDLITLSVVAGALIVHVFGPGRQPLSATVKSLEQPSGQFPLHQTTETGQAAFSLLHPGLYTIQASSTGYSNGTTTVNVSLNKTSVTEITLNPVSSPSGTSPYYLIAGGVATGAVAAGALLIYRRRSKNPRALANRPASKNIKQR